MASLTVNSTTPANPNPSTPSYPDDVEWITAYLTIHCNSVASEVYCYILWIAVAAALLVCTFAHLASARSGYFGAVWNKWALRRRTWRKKHSLTVAFKSGQPHTQPTALPSNAQILTLTFIIIPSLVLCFIGPDYLAPGSTLWDSTPQSFVSRRASFDVSTFVPPQYTISKAWWTSGNRTGLVAFALFPLCVLFALKAPPFALLSLSFTVQLHFDKLAWLHKWSGRLIWFITTLHVAFWSVQLIEDRRTGTGKIAYTYAWDFPRFIYAWVAYGLMTLLMLSSIHWIRQYHYETFYLAHIILVPATIIMSAFHHPQVWWWCGAALAIWAGERIWRTVWWLHINGYFGSMQPSAPPSRQHAIPHSRSEVWQLQQVRSPKDGVSPLSATVVGSPGGFIDRPVFVPPPGYALAELISGRTIRLRLITPGFRPWAPGQHFLIRVPSVSSYVTHPFTVASVCDMQSRTDDGRELVFLIRAKSGWTRRLWDTIAQTIARGQTHVRGERPPVVGEIPARGVLLRTQVDGPFGSAERAQWGSYSSVLIIAGGSGVSFGLSVLQYLCMCLSGRDGQYLGSHRGGYGQPGFQTRRVRFVWLVREFGHIQWCASQLRRCRAMIPFPELQIDIFVTNVKPTAHPDGRSPMSPISPITPYPPSFPVASAGAATSDGFTPPPERYGREPRRRDQSRPRMRSPASSVHSDVEDADVDLSYYYSGEAVAEDGELGHEEHVLDLTNFEGDTDFMLPGEARFSMNIKQEGHRRRADTRRKSQLLLVANGKDGYSRRMLSPLHATTMIPEEPEEDKRPSLTQLKMAELAMPSGAALLHPQNTLNTPVSPYADSPTPVNEQASSRPFSVQSGHSNTHSMVDLVQEDWTRLRLDLDDQELQDVSVVAEHARPGKPKLEHILADEVRQAQGPIVVGCCGPTSLNAMIRKVIAAQINPARIRAGDMRGSISLVAEDFEY